MLIGKFPEKAANRSSSWPFTKVSKAGSSKIASMAVSKWTSKIQMTNTPDIAQDPHLKYKGYSSSESTSGDPTSGSFAKHACLLVVYSIPTVATIHPRRKGIMKDSTEDELILFDSSKDQIAQLAAPRSANPER
jgi:hypothetical protein